MRTEKRRDPVRNRRGLWDLSRYDLARTRRTGPPKAVVRVVVERVIVAWCMGR